MPDERPSTGPRHEPEYVYERAPDPAEAAKLPLEPKSPGDRLLAADEPEPETAGPDRPPPHHRLNTPVGEVSQVADSDPYRKPTEDDEADTASGTFGVHQGTEGRG